MNSCHHESHTALERQMQCWHEWSLFIRSKSSKQDGCQTELVTMAIPPFTGGKSTEKLLGGNQIHILS